MASLEQWTTWREDYLWGLRSAIESCAFKFASISTSQRGVAFDYNKAMNLVAEAIEKGYLDESESSYLFKLASFCLFSADNQRRLFSYHAKDALYDYKLHVYKQTDIISSLKNFNGFLGSAFWFVYLPLIDAIGYYTKNHPLVYREWLLKAADGNYDFSYCGLTKAQLFDYFCSMSQYGLYKLFVDNKYRQAEDLFDSVQANDYDRYIRICSESDIDLTKVSEIAGYILNGLSISAFEDGEGSADSKARALFAMVGVRKAEKDEIDKLLHKVYNHEFVCEVLHMDLTEEESFHLTSWAYYVSMYLPYLELFDDDELFELNKVLDNPYFTGFMKIVQFVRLAMNCSIPQKIKLLLSPEEKDRFLPHSIIESIQENIDDRSFTHKTDNASEDSEIDVQDDADMDFSSQITGVSQGLAPKVKNLASRWMTRPYHRMTDDVLVDIISKKIWPELMEDVDGLMWTPQKRNQPTFQKTKIQLAACLLFHAMERAKIAKLPKQEEQDNSYEGPLGEEDRARAGVYTTSNRRAGISHTKKKWNDTLPLGYVEMYRSFLRTDELPTRTTSRTYLKLLNVWIWKTYESLLDRVSNEKDAKGFEAEMRLDLGHQFYLYTDDKNRKILKALVNKWKEELPPLFNIPI